MLLFFRFRHILATLHFNLNLDRETKKRPDGTEQLRVSYPKFKNGEATVRNICVAQKFGKKIFFIHLLYFREGSTMNSAFYVLYCCCQCILSYSYSFHSYHS